MGTTFVTVRLEPEKCCQCGIIFGLDADFQRRLRGTHQAFYCPNGHGQHYPGKTEAQKLRDELVATNARLDRAKADADWQRQLLETEKRSAAAAKGRLTKLRNRIDAGVCPCCNRHFANLHKHMQTQHAEDPKSREDMVAKIKAAKQPVRA